MLPASGLDLGRHGGSIRQGGVRYAKKNAAKRRKGRISPFLATR